MRKNAWFIALIMVFVMLAVVVGPVPGNTAIPPCLSPGFAYADDISTGDVVSLKVIRVPIWKPGTTEQFGTVVMEYPASLGVDSSANFTISLPSGFSIEEHYMTDLNACFDSIDSSHSDNTISAHLNSFLLTDYPGRIEINITAYIPDDYEGDIVATFSGDISGTVVMGRVVEPPPFLPDVFAIRLYLQDQIDALQANNQMSNDEVYSFCVDLSQVPQGSVSATVYKTEEQAASTTNYTNIVPQPIEGINGAHDKLVRFWFYLDNNDDESCCAQWGSAPENTIIGYVYGTTKDQTLDSFVAGIPECLGNVRLYDYGASGGGSPPPSEGEENEPEQDPEEWAEKYLTTTFTIETTTYTKVVGDSTEDVTMDVSPYIKNDRTYVPIRYLAYALGVPEDGITWDNDAKEVRISTDEVTIILTIDSTIMTVNSKPVTMDVAPEITNGRTMLPARWVAEALGAEVEWDEATQEISIKIPEK